MDRERRNLTREERVEVFWRVGLGESRAAVARALGVHRSTVTRVLGGKPPKLGTPPPPPASGAGPVYRFPETEARGMAELVEDLVSIADVARAYNCPVSTVVSTVRRLGVEPRGRGLARALVPTLAAMAADAPPTVAASALVDFVVQNWPEQDMDAVSRLAAHGFTVQEARFLLALDSSPRGLPTQEMWGRLVGDGSEQGPGPKLVDVVASKCRRKLMALNWPIRIVSVWGWGKQLVCDDPDWSIPEVQEPHRARLIASVR